MRVLIVAPHPFYQERGTPLAVDMLMRVLCARKESVDVLTYNIGEDRSYPGCSIYRINTPLKFKEIRSGFGLAKVLLDICVFWKLILMLKKRRYDVIHCVEESAFMAWALYPFFRVPYICDKDSIMSMQMAQGFPALRKAESLMGFLEALPLPKSLCVAAVCDEVADWARARGARRVVLLKDAVQGELLQGVAEDIRSSFGINEKIVMYAGSLEAHQGIDLLLESFRIVASQDTAHLVIIGGLPRDIEKYQRRADSLGFGPRVHFLGPRPIVCLIGYLRQADVLVSPRIRGNNTPMKIFSYLYSEVPLCATNIVSHTQVLSPDNSILAAPEKEAFARAIMKILADRQLGARIARNGRQLIDCEYKYENLECSINSLYDTLKGGVDGN
ncbi:MAG: glycosyltransferase family 4 protein [Candidatus Omnitrophica bacterium]|nr:glycosyltransferase family 4 protein [Candidatus Omnitrophota bacterium]